MIIDNTDSLSPEVLQALKRDIFSSLRVALPGIVQAWDPETRTADDGDQAVCRQGSRSSCGFSG